jgi:glycogen(starch) synthase
MLSWEYPPLSVGGVAAHVDGLGTALVALGHEVVLMTRSHASSEEDSEFSGVRVLRCDAEMPWISPNVGAPGAVIGGTSSGPSIAQVASANHSLVNLSNLLGDWQPDIVHAHDWHVAWAADVCARRFEVPLITTFHGTERSRHGGHLPPGNALDINSVEWWLAFRSQRIIAGTRLMAREIASGFEMDPVLIHRIPNGIDTTWWTSGETPESLGEPVVKEPLLVDASLGGPVVLTWGRVQFEKGFQVLARAMTLLRQRVPGITCLIAGRGSYIPELQSQIDIEGVSDIVTLMGYVSDPELRELIHHSTCVVIPSLYEPFGVVALEALAAGAALVVANTGGLAELAGGTGAALLFEPGNTVDLADRIEELIFSPELATQLKANARELLEASYTWRAIAARTLEVYREVLPS